MILRHCPVCDDLFVYCDVDYCPHCAKFERVKRPPRMKSEKIDNRKMNKPRREKRYA